MAEAQKWLVTTFRTLVTWLDGQWSTFVRGVMYEWPIGYFVLAMGALLVVGLVTIWHRGANR